MNQNRIKNNMNRVLVLIFLIFLSSCNFNQKNAAQKNNEFCQNEIALIKPNDSLKILNLKLASKPDSLLNIIEKELKYVFCYEVTTFGIKIDKTPIKTFVFKECPDLKVHFFPRLEILLNNKNKALLENSEIIDIDSIPNWFLYNFPDKAKQSWQKNHIRFYWSNLMTEKQINNGIKLIIKGYLNKINAISKEIYNKDVCDLTGAELLKIKEKIPFELELASISESVYLEMIEIVDDE